MTDIVGLEAGSFRSRKSTRLSARWGDTRRWLSGAAVIGLLGFTVWDLEIGRRPLINGRGFSELGRFARASLSPTLNRDIGKLVWSGTITTLAYAVVGTVLSSIAGFVIAVGMTGARRDRSTPSAIGKVVAALTVPLRGIHEVLWALILINLLGIDPLVAVLAIVVPFSAVSAKVFSELFLAQSRPPFESLRSLGARPIVSFFYGVLPLAAKDCLSYGFYRFECAIRSAAVLGVVGAGGLGYQLLLSFQSTNYNEMWTFLWALIALSAVVDWMSSRMRRSRPQPSANRRFSFGNLFLLGVFLSLGMVAALYLKLSPWHLWSKRTRREMSFLWDQVLPAEFGGSYLRELGRLARETIAISIGSMMVSLAIAVFGSFLSARSNDQSAMRRGVGWITRAALLIARSIPAAVWAYLAVIAFFSGPFPAAVALGIYNGGVLGRMLAEVVENLDRRPRNALLASGASELAASLYASVPLASPSYATYALYRWEVAMRETIVVGIAAAGGLGAHLKQLLAAFAWPKVFTALLAMILLTLVVELVSKMLRHQIQK